MNVKSWLEQIYYNAGKQKYDFFVCGLKKNGEDIKATKWKKFSEVVFPIDNSESYKLDWINQRQILPNEIVLDLEHVDKLPAVVIALNELKLNYNIFATHSHGFHIHLFFEEELTEMEKEAVIEYFGADIQKSSLKTMIALEFVPHWKSGKIKELIENGV